MCSFLSLFSFLLVLECHFGCHPGQLPHRPHSRPTPASSSAPLSTTLITPPTPTTTTVPDPCLDCILPAIVDGSSEDGCVVDQPTTIHVSSRSTGGTCYLNVEGCESNYFYGTQEGCFLFSSGEISGAIVCYNNSFYDGSKPIAYFINGFAEYPWSSQSFSMARCVYVVLLFTSVVSKIEIPLTLKTGEAIFFRLEFTQNYNIHFITPTFNESRGFGAIFLKFSMEFSRVLLSFDGLIRNTQLVGLVNKTVPFYVMDEGGQWTIRGEGWNGTKSCTINASDVKTLTIDPEPSSSFFVGRCSESFRFPV